MSKKRELLKKELEHFHFYWGSKDDQWYKNLILLMAEILVEEEQR